MEKAARIYFWWAKDRIEESEARLAESEPVGLGPVGVDAVASSDCPEVITRVGKATPPEVAMVGLAGRRSDERVPSSSLDFVAGEDALWPVETEAPLSDCTELFPPTVLVVTLRVAVIGAVAPALNEPPDPYRYSLRLTDLVSSEMPAPTDALARVETVSDTESSELDR